MKRKLILVLLIIVIFFVGIASSYAQCNVRGKIVRSDSYYRTTYPVPYVPVTLYHRRQGRSRPVYTDVDGMYYFYNFPCVDYILEIWDLGFKYKPLSFKIYVNQPYTNIKPITIK
jgi:hypothetical protein